MNYEKHITVLSILYLCNGALVLLGGGVAVLLVLGSGIAADQIPITGGIAAFIGVFLLLLAIPSFIGGWGLMRRKSWSRLLVLVLGFLSLFSFPLGTALGIYTIWLLMQDGAEAFFAEAPEHLSSTLPGNSANA